MPWPTATLITAHVTEAHDAELAAVLWPPPGTRTSSTGWGPGGRERHVLTGAAFQSIGLGFAAAVGAAVSRTDRTTVVALGDGGALTGPNWRPWSARDAQHSW